MYISRNRSYGLKNLGSISFLTGTLILIIFMSTIIRRKWNRVEALKNDSEEWIYDENTLKCMIQEFYVALFTKIESSQILPFTDFPLL